MALLLAAAAFAAAPAASAGAAGLPPETPAATPGPDPSWTGCEPEWPGVRRTSATCGAVIMGEVALHASPPPDAPPAVKKVIAAANRIDRTPYIWGGGHLSWRARGYDCSGAVSYALHGGRLLGSRLVSGELAHWGAPGKGRWITVYANSEHVFMIVAGLRYDTRDDLPGESGPRWHSEIQWSPLRSGRGFAVRHPPGL
jgi:hypothetical protein